MKCWTLLFIVTIVGVFFTLVLANSMLTAMGVK